MKLNLTVLRSSDMEALAKFYSALFERELEKHRHGKGPEHFGTELGELVFEIYPQRSEADDTTSVRLGYLVDSIESVLDRISGFAFTVVSEAKDSAWGKRMVLDDPEGHRMELTESNSKEQKMQDNMELS
ncbi:MAG: VOC family protein [Akkermansiaceae bacterium]